MTSVWIVESYNGEIERVFSSCKKAREYVQSKIAKCRISWVNKKSAFVYDVAAPDEIEFKIHCWYIW